MKYRSRQVIVEAVQFDAERWLYERKEAFPMVETKECLGGTGSLGGFFTYEPILETSDGDKSVKDDDYIIRGAYGEFYTCNTDDFNKIYELVDVEQPVTWQQALEARTTGKKDIYCELEDEVYSYQVHEPRYEDDDWDSIEDSYGDSISAREILNGTWYIRN